MVYRFAPFTSLISRTRGCAKEGEDGNGGINWEIRCGRLGAQACARSRRIEEERTEEAFVLIREALRGTFRSRFLKGIFLALICNLV